MNISNSGNDNVPFEGFSLQHSTSSSQENDAFVEEAQIANAPKNLEQKYVKQVYPGVTEELTNRQGEVVTTIKDRSGKTFFPLERKPFVFEQNGEVCFSGHHIEEIKQEEIKRENS